MHTSSFRLSKHDSIVRCVFFVSPWWPDIQRSAWPRERAIYSWLRHCGMCCAWEETVTKYNRRTDPLPRVFRGGLDLPCRKGWPRSSYTQQWWGPSFPESRHRHARMGNRLPVLSFFSRPRDISGRALVTGYALTSRQANFWQSSTAPPKPRVNLRGHRTNFNIFYRNIRV